MDGDHTARSEEEVEETAGSSLALARLALDEHICLSLIYSGGGRGAARLTLRV